MTFRTWQPRVGEVRSWATTIKRDARTKLACYPRNATEIALNQYLLKHYKYTLIEACLALIGACTITTDFNGSLIISWPKKAFNNLATLITFGTGRLVGSPILKCLFM